MYAHRYQGSSRFNPGGLAAAIGINGAVVAALMLVAPYVVHKDPPKPLVGETIDLTPLPPDPPPPAKTDDRTQPRPTPTIDVPTPIVDPLVDSGPVVAADPFPPIPGDPALASGTGTGDGVAVEPPPVPKPVIVAPGIDPRFAGDFQPLYPPSEQRAAHAGKVTVRVLVGTDGRVRQVEPVSATSDAFLRATLDQAKRRWRFTPGTRDGIAQEAWRVMTVTFVLQD